MIGNDFFVFISLHFPQLFYCPLHNAVPTFLRNISSTSGGATLTFGCNVSEIKNL